MPDEMPVDATAGVEDPLEGLDVATKIDLWRQKQMNGTLTDDELKLAVQAIRAGRIAAAQQGAKTRAAKGPVKTQQQLLDELEGL